MMNTPEKINEYRLKIDIITPLEYFFLWMIVLSVIMFCVFIFKDDTRPLLWVPLVTGAISTFLYKKTDNFYIIDTSKQKIIYHFFFLGFTREKEKYSFNDVFCVMPNTKREHRKSGSRWLNYLTILMKDGTFLRISDGSREYNSKENSKNGLDIAALIPVPYNEIGKSVQMRIKNRPVRSMDDLVAVSARKLDCEYIVKILTPIGGIVVISLLLSVLMND
jgi:hypothetical protein